MVGRAADSFGRHTELRADPTCITRTFHEQDERQITTNDPARYKITRPIKLRGQAAGPGMVRHPTRARPSVTPTQPRPSPPARSPPWSRSYLRRRTRVQSQRQAPARARDWSAGARGPARWRRRWTGRWARRCGWRAGAAAGDRAEWEQESRSARVAESEPVEAASGGPRDGKASQSLARGPGCQLKPRLAAPPTLPSWVRFWPVSNSPPLQLLSLNGFPVTDANSTGPNVHSLGLGVRRSSGWGAR